MDPKKNQEVEALPIRIRKATEADVPFIFSSWLKSYRQSPTVRNIANTSYYTEHHKVIENLLQSCEVYVACKDTDTAEIYGFICAEVVSGIFVLHYVYTKHTYRGLGIANQLLSAYERADGAAMYTHFTMPATKLAEKYMFVYNPYIALLPSYRVKEPTSGT